MRVNAFSGVCCFLMKMTALILSSKRNYPANGKWRTLSNLLLPNTQRCHDSPLPQPFWKTPPPEQEPSLFCLVLYHLALCLTHHRCVWQNLTVLSTPGDTWGFPSSSLVRLAIWFKFWPKERGHKWYILLPGLALEISCAVLYLLFQHTRQEIKTSESVQPENGGSQVETAKEFAPRKTEQRRHQQKLALC